MESVKSPYSSAPVVKTVPILVRFRQGGGTAVTARDELWPIAVEQYGFITTSDARDVGVDPTALRKLAHRGRLEHVAHGVYRFRELPVTGRDDFMRALLSTGVRDAALSHDTALLALDLCDVNPTAIHVTVPRRSRIRRKTDRVALHHLDLTPSEVRWWEGMRSVTADTAIWQGMQSGVPRHLLEQATVTAARRGEITAEQHEEAASALALL
ncbi:Transcriptional regulator, AbiEi antitoxin, Type IV TA system [Curtobacterium sp. UNCCL20]|uniref:type IV toxin-antitoxin system AbiEi family antitoxin domain-containing protein n=1 Tax=Curtobacterium sp. UNCCL20 TaxID=1502773 RepID=UPI00087F3B59|nr:type IV toxin-antitoxin system AbiEi family antitoxin domain-containing protein [Curtobacterium sp. UNCCL20]SDQ57996.1 Transcriptional regulator, AbiEi antitoxin, Type IV TA system [Curtobacterium sp. UNCCL20]